MSMKRGVVFLCVNSAVPPGVVICCDARGVPLDKGADPMLVARIEMNQGTYEALIEKVNGITTIIRD